MIPAPPVAHPPRPGVTLDAAYVEAVVDALAAGEPAVVPNALPQKLVAALRAAALAREAAGGLVPAAVGRGAMRTTQPTVRGDRIAWLDAGSSHPAERAYGNAMEVLRERLNRELMLGLAELEAHYALYPPGTFYARHRDRFRDDDRRQVSCIVYLNEVWHARDGGALRLYLASGDAPEILPIAGTLVAFLADAFEHEVLPATRPRLAITGWFRRRGSP